MSGTRIGNLGEPTSAAEAATKGYVDTTAAGLIAAQTMATATATNIGDKANAINTTGKTKGKFVYNTTSDLVYFALGTTDVAKWRLSGSVDNTGDVTPS